MPGIQGTLVKATTRANSSMVWGIFYQTVNIGGFLGPPQRQEGDVLGVFSDPLGRWRT